MDIVPFKREHLSNLALQKMQTHMAPLLSDPAYGEGLEAQPLSFTAIEDGKVYACGGLIEEWHGVARAWMLITGEMNGKFMPIHRAVKRAINANLGTAFHRIEMSVLKHHEEGCRWANMLGFEFEGLARKYSPDGEDFYKYARVV
jgi:hypothetical protein